MSSFLYGLKCTHKCKSGDPGIYKQQQINNKKKEEGNGTQGTLITRIKMCIENWTIKGLASYYQTFFPDFLISLKFV